MHFFIPYFYVSIKKKKTPDVIKEELLDLLMEIEDNDEPGLHEVVKNTKEPEETIRIIKRYKEISKSQSLKLISIESKDSY